MVTGSVLYRLQIEANQADLYSLWRALKLFDKCGLNDRIADKLEELVGGDVARAWNRAWNGKNPE